MGDFTTAGDIRKLYKKIDTAGLTDLDVNFYVKMAESEVKGYVAARYDLPFASVPVLIRDVSSELALLKILDRFFVVEDENVEKSGRRARRKDLQKLLDGIADGSIVLVVDDAVIAPSTSTHGIASSTSQYVPTHGHGPIIDEEVDPNRIDDEQRKRD